MAFNRAMLITLVVLISLLTPCRPQGRTHQPNYCDSSVKVPESPPRSCYPLDGGMSSCVGRCNHTTNPDIQEHCKCDAYCILYKDCCPDFRNTCPMNYVQGLDIKKKQIHSKVDCVQFLFLEEDEDGKRKSYVDTVSLISSCANGDICAKTSQEDILHPNLAVPITDVKTGLQYVNFHCAKCNNVSEFKWWVPRLECETLADAKGSPVITDSTSLREHLQNCGLHYLKPWDGRYNTRYGCKFHGIMDVTSLLNTCPSSCLNTYVVYKCEDAFTTDYFQNGGRIYPNIYCAMCANEDVDQLTCYKSPGTVEVVSLKKYSLSVLYRFDPDAGLEVGEMRCPSGHEMYLEGKECKKIMCPTDFSLVGKECVPIRYKGIISVVITFQKSFHLKKAFLEFKATNSVRNTLVEDIQPVLMRKGFREDFVSSKIEANIISTLAMNVSLIYKLSVGYNQSSLHYSMEDLHRDLNSKFERAVERWLKTLFGDKEIALETEAYYNTEQAYFINCTWKAYPSNSFKTENGSVFLNDTEEKHPTEKYRVMEDMILLCVEERNDGKRGPKFPYVFNALLIVAIVIGIFGFGIQVFRTFKLSFYRDPKSGHRYRIG